MSVKSGTITVYLMRHAESSSNLKFVGDKDENIRETELSDLGREQIKNVAKVWKDVKFRKVFSSDFKRAMETAEYLLDCQDGSIYQSGKFKPDVETDKNLREMDFGQLNKASYAEISLYYLSLNEPYLEWKYPEGETVLDVGRRMLNFLDNCCTGLFENGGKFESFNVLIVSHRVSIAALLYLLSRPVDGGSKWVVENFDGEKDIRLLDNTGYYKLEIGEMEMAGFLRVKVVEKHVVGHLDGIEGGKIEKVEIKREKLRERLLQASSEKGRKVLGCSQQ